MFLTQTAPTIFTQLFTVIGLIKRNLPAIARQEVYAVPLVFALLSSKEKEQYASVLRGVLSAAREYGVGNCVPRQIMGDFERGIISASNEVFPDVQYSGCFFHLCQSMYRKVIELHLRREYTDPDDR